MNLAYKITTNYKTCLHPIVGLSMRSIVGNETTTAKKQRCGKSRKRLYLTTLHFVFHLLLSMSMSIMVLSGSIDRLMFFCCFIGSIEKRFETVVKLVFREPIQTKYITDHGKIWLSQYQPIVVLLDENVHWRNQYHSFVCFLTKRFIGFLILFFCI